MDTTRTLQDFVTRARKPDATDRDTFRALMSEGVTLSGLTLQEVAEALRCSPGSVSRWIHGHSAPGEIVRRQAVRFLADRVRRQALGLEAAERDNQGARSAVGVRALANA